MQHNAQMMQNYAPPIQATHLWHKHDVGRCKHNAKIKNEHSKYEENVTLEWHKQNAKTITHTKKNRPKVWAL